MKMDLLNSNILSFLLENWKLLLFLLSIYGFYYYATSTFDYFKKKGISYIKPVLFFGSLSGLVLDDMTYHEFQLYIYDYFKGKAYGGVFEGLVPVLYIFDLDLIKAITVRDFDHFTDRKSLQSNEPRYLQRTLNKLKGSDWKIVRSTITPSFSSARLKNMMTQIQQISDQMVKFLERYDKTDIEMKNLAGHLNLEVIGACAFGIKTNALADDNALLVKLAEQITHCSPIRNITLMIFILFLPKLLRFVNLSLMNSEPIRELTKILKVTKAERRQIGSRKHDFLQLAIDAADKEKKEAEATNAVLHMDEDTIDAQSIIFLMAGYDTTSTALTYGIHTLAIHPHIQDKLREHILEVTNGREITYDLLSQLTYLDGFIFETLRMYSPLGNVQRMCTKEYILPGTNIKIDVDDIICIPLHGIHMDPDIYPEPHVFRPERFMGDEKRNRPSHHYLAFGAGPRNCIGMRFAMMTIKLSMISLLKNFKFSTCAKTENPVKAIKNSMVLKPANGIWVKLEKI